MPVRCISLALIQRDRDVAPVQVLLCHIVVQRYCWAPVVVQIRCAVTLCCLMVPVEPGRTIALWLFHILSAAGLLRVLCIYLSTS